MVELIQFGKEGTLGSTNTQTFVATWPFFFVVCVA